MGVHAALVRPVLRTSRGRHAKPRPAWPWAAGWAAVLVLVAIWGPPALLLVPAAALVLIGAKLRTAARKIDTIFAEELTAEDPRETDQESDSAAEAA
ncbi:hypothetical protein [Amycolatopsis sp. cmx-4-68]|uniref:hypothetical protein n=1 Tax=Amycolatopsis sp. cmx-4-68 TaxID=2790938 RepID=UPI00397C7386